MTDPSEFHGSVARFLSLSDSSVVGSGVILPGGWVLTCAHVAAAAVTGSKNFGRIPPSAKFVDLDVARGGGRAPLKASFEDCIWGPADEDYWNTAGDYVFLKLQDRAVPAGLVLARTAISQLRGVPLYAYGFPDDYQKTGRSASLTASNIPFGEADGLVRIHRDGLADEFIKPGFSGAPVSAVNQDYSVVGMIKASYVADKVEEAYIIPGYTLQKAFSRIGLKQHEDYIRQQQTDHPPQFSQFSTRSFESEFGIRDLKMSKVSARVWRYMDRKYASDPYSGLGSSLFGGRFNERGSRAIYFALTADAAIRELQSYVRVTEVESVVLLTYEISCQVFDARDPNERAGLYLALDPIVQPRQEDAKSVLTHEIALRLREEGFDGLIYPSFLQREDSQLVLWNLNQTDVQIRVVDSRTIDIMGLRP